MGWAPDYIDTEETAEFLRIQTDTDMANLARAIAAASRTINKKCRRQFGNAAGTRLYTPRYDYARCAWVVDIDDVMTTEGFEVTAGGSAVTSDYYTLGPLNAEADGMPWTRLVFARSVRLTGVEGEVSIDADPWGWTDVPVTIGEACHLQVSHLHARRESPFGVAGSPQSGTELRLLAKLDPDVELIVRSYRRVVLPL